MASTITAVDKPTLSEAVEPGSVNAVPASSMSGSSPSNVIVGGVTSFTLTTNVGVSVELPDASLAVHVASYVPAGIGSDDVSPVVVWQPIVGLGSTLLTSCAVTPASRFTNASPLTASAIAFVGFAGKLVNTGAALSRTSKKISIDVLLPTVSTATQVAGDGCIG